MISATRSFALAACGTFLASLCGTAPLRGSDKEGLTPGLLQDPPPAAPSAPAAGPVKLTTTQVALAVAQAKSRLQWDKLERMQRQLERLELNRDLYWNANYRSIVAMQMKKLRDECQGVRQGLVTLENRIRSLESASRSGSAPSPGHLAAAPRERAEQLGAGLESKADSPSGPSHRDDPFFFVTRQSVSGEIRRQKVKTNLVSGKAIPTQLVRGHQGGIGFVNAELREWGMLHPDADRTGAKFFRSKDHLKSYDVCSDQRNTYFAYLTPHGTVIGGIDVRRTCPDLFLVNKDFKDEPLGLVSFSNMLYLIGANQMLVMSHRADESGAEAQLYHRVQGSPFLPGTRFLVVDEHLHFCEPGGATYGRVRERLFSRSAGFTIERFQLPKGAKATAMALAPGPADGKAGHGDLLCITDADHDSIHQIDPADMQVKRTIHLVPGTRPGDLAEGPRGTLIFATARGFGCLTAAGEARQVKLHGNPKVRPAGLVSVPEQGKVYFLDRPQPGIAVLNLFALDGKGSAGPNGDHIRLRPVRPLFDHCEVVRWQETAVQRPTDLDRPILV